MQQATLAQSVEQRIRNAQVVSSSLMSGSAKAGSSSWNFPLLLLLPIQPGAKGQVLPPNPVFILLSGAKVFILHPMRLRNVKNITCIRFVFYFRVQISFGRRSVLEVHD